MPAADIVPIFTIDSFSLDIFWERGKILVYQKRSYTMSFKPEVEVVGEKGKWYQNGQTFATREEAEKSARNRFNSWFSCTDHRAVEVSSEEFPVNYMWVDGVGDVRIADELVGKIVLLTPPEDLTAED
jgi:hypothetical protein